MKSKIRRLSKNFLLGCLLLSLRVNSISLVYNLKTRRVFRLNTALKSGKKSIWLLTVLPIIYKRSRHVEGTILNTNLQPTVVDVFEKRTIAGSVFNLRYLYKKKLWFEISTGAEKETACSSGTLSLNETRKGMDDLVVSLGYNVFPNEKIQISPYLIGGIPITQHLTSEEIFDTFIGTRFYGLGAGVELSYTFVNSLKETFSTLIQTRLLHFFKRKWEPILPCNAILKPGNVTDILIGGQYRKNRNLFELGYDVTFFTNQAVLLTTGSIETDKFTRNSFYFNFGHFFQKFPILGKNSVLLGAGFYLAGLKRYDTQISSFWVNFTYIF